MTASVWQRRSNELPLQGAIRAVPRIKVMLSWSVRNFSVTVEPWSVLAGGCDSLTAIGQLDDSNPGIVGGEHRLRPGFHQEERAIAPTPEASRELASDLHLWTSFGRGVCHTGGRDAPAMDAHVRRAPACGATVYDALWSSHNGKRSRHRHSRVGV
jgi:hypothetical protein